MKTLLFKCLILGLILTLLLGFVSDPFFKETNINSKTFNGFQEHKNNLDILIVGSSHAKVTFAPQILDSIFRTNTYNLATGGQSLISTNLILEDVLKKNKPKLVVIDLFPTLMKRPTSPVSKGAQLRVLDYAIPSIRRLKAINKIYNLKETPSVLHETIRNHDKWYEANWTLSKFDAGKKLIYEKGYVNYNKSMSKKDTEKLKNYIEEYKTFLNPETPSNIDIEAFIVNNPDLEETINILEKHDAKGLFVSAPYFPSFYRGSLNKTHKILERYLKNKNQHFIDFNALFLNLNLSLDDFWNDGHVNASGSRIVSMYLAKKIADKDYFDIENRRYFNKNFKNLNLKNNKEVKDHVFSKDYEKINEILEGNNKYIINHKFQNKIEIQRMYVHSEKQQRIILLKATNNVSIEDLKEKYFTVHLTIKKEDFHKRPKLLLGTNKNKLFFHVDGEFISLEGNNYIVLALDKKCEIETFEEIKLILKAKNDKSIIGRVLKVKL